MLNTNFREAVALGGFPRSRALHENKTVTNDQWAKGSIGMASGSQGFTSDGRNFTEGLNYSSSALDLASHANMP